MNARLRKHRLAMAIGMTAAALTLPAQEKPLAGPFTTAQSGDGQKLYQAMCSSCHRPDLTGHNDTPPLAGKYFVKQWRDRSVQDLLGYLRTTMPPRSQGSLTDETAADLVAFILEANGATAGTAPLTASINVVIRRVLPVDVPERSGK
jgi:mono/diheme cytochrome c family protein